MNSGKSLVEQTRTGEKCLSYDPVEDLSTDAAAAVFMEEALKTGDETYIAHARGVVERAKGKMCADRTEPDESTSDEAEPLKQQVPNAGTLAAMEEARAAIKARSARFTEPGALFEALEPKA